MKPNSITPGLLGRRDFLKLSGLVATGLAFTKLPVMAGPFADTNEYLEVISKDKRLNPKWVRSLFERGEKETYTDPRALAHIGMPIGGFFAGTVYLGGDGRLWLWDIFNKDQEGIEPRKSVFPYEEFGKPVKNTTRWGLNYREPAVPQSPISQGFTLRIKDQVHPLNSTGFGDIRFDGRYPMATVLYRDAACPVTAELTAFSPFIPLDLDDSSLPATIMSYRVRNPSNEKVEVVLEGHLENPICGDSRPNIPGQRINRVVRRKNFTAIECLAKPASAPAEAAAPAQKLEAQRDFGSMTLLLLGAEKGDRASAQSAGEESQAEGGLNASLTGRVSRKLVLQPGETATVEFAFTWHFPNFSCRADPSGGKREWTGHYYAARFDSALAVAAYLADNFARLSGTTRTWVETWYDSTLPYWLLDRTMANTSTLATTTCYRLKDGRFWAWEGIGCCPGTCTHVWHYAQAPGRLFPELERIARERTDFGIAQHEDGGIGMRAGLTRSNDTAIDGQCGRILGVLREYQMSSDDAFLRRLWPKVRKAIEFLIREDGNDDGILEGKQQNTLDAAWYGKVSFISSLYLAALRAGQVMATEMGDTAFAQQCQAIADKGAKNFSEMFNGEYFYQIEDPKHLDKIAGGTGCFIDQVFGQTWAYWVGLGALFDRKQTLSALRSLWTYNFVPDVGPFREKFKLGRWYAMAGDAGLVMCTWPKGGMRKDQEKIPVYRYFNECMSGFEHQVAAHMVWEGRDQPDLLQDGLAVERAIHDRYNATLRNPYNEIECSDHYSRAMASYGVYQAVCGFECHGPKGEIAFAPRLTPENFRCAFITAAGWGAFSQKIASGRMEAEVAVRWGSLTLQTVKLTPKGFAPKQVTLQCAGKTLPARLVQVDGVATITLEKPLKVASGETLKVTLG